MNRYMTSFRNRTEIQSKSNIPLNQDQLMEVAPSIYQDQAHDSRSSRYTTIPTCKVLESLENEGWKPFYVAQTRARDASKKSYSKHMIRLRHINYLDVEETNELILINSHDGSSSYRLMPGVFRFVCANGLMTGDVFNDIRVHHKGNILDGVIEGACTVLKDFEKIDENKEQMKAVALSEPEKMVLAKSALSLRWDDHVPVSEEQIMHPRRKADLGDDLWTTFNVVQENIIQGGMRGITKKNKRSRVRAVSGINSNTAINKGLWILADEMRKLKEA